MADLDQPVADVDEGFNDDSAFDDTENEADETDDTTLSNDEPDELEAIGNNLLSPLSFIRPPGNRTSLWENKPCTKMRNVKQRKIEPFCSAAL